MDAEIKSYLLKAAEACEKSGFLAEAAQIYKNLDPEKSKACILKVAEKAEKNKLWYLLADCYELLGDEEKTRSVWKRVAREMKSTGAPDILVKEALEKSKPEPKERERRSMFFREAVSLESQGKFLESKKEWAKSAKIEEKEGNFRFAAKLYSNACLLKDAKKCWKIAQRDKKK